MSAPRTSQIQFVTYGQQDLEVKFGTFSGSGTVAVVAAVTGKKIRLLGAVWSNAAAGTFTWKSGTTGLSGAISQAINQVVVMPPTPLGYLQTAAGEALNLTASAGAVNGFVIYCEI